jgi:hypothetical protein
MHLKELTPEGNNIPIYFCWWIFIGSFYKVSCTSLKSFFKDIPKGQHVPSVYWLSNFQWISAEQNSSRIESI